MVAVRLMTFDQCRNYKTTPQKTMYDRVSHWPRGKTFGGCSSINGGGYIRGNPEDYDEWEQKFGCKGWLVLIW
jgi:choline dehydrogenase